jgi:8-oxo-dGTP pyrophosphatase MutT (NUDIX family)
MEMLKQTPTIEDIQKLLAGPLPGQPGQIKMAPQRPENQPNRWDVTPPDCREAGVLLLFYPRQPENSNQALSFDSELYLVLMRRNEYPGVHSGQISLPGGRRENSETLQTTALREAHEELGVFPKTLQIIGELSPLYTPPSNFCIYPFVAYSAVSPTFRPDPKEVAEVVELPLRLLCDPTIRCEEFWQFPEWGRRRVPFFDVFGHQVWGATAMILSEFLTLFD